MSLKLTKKTVRKWALKDLRFLITEEIKYNLVQSGNTIIAVDEIIRRKNEKIKKLKRKLKRPWIYLSHEGRMGWDDGEGGKG